MIKIELIVNFTINVSLNFKSTFLLLPEYNSTDIIHFTKLQKHFPLFGNEKKIYFSSHFHSHSHFKDVNYKLTFDM